MSDVEVAPLAAPATTKKRAPPKAAMADPGVSLLPTSRVHKIIKADKDVRLCSKEAIFLISKATVRSFPWLPRLRGEVDPRNAS